MEPRLINSIDYELAVEPFLRCYKYRSGAAALRNLSEGTFYFASPNELNDSLEAKFDLAGARKYADIMNATFTEIARSRGHEGEIPKKLPKGLPAATAEANKKFAKSCKRIGIFSAAPRPDNQPMWAYYCNNNQGVCFELEWSQEDFERYQLWPTNVSYTNESRLFNRADDSREMLLDLARANPDWSLDQLHAFSMTEPYLRKLGIKGVARAVSMKHSDWAHEQEIRILSPYARLLPLTKSVLKSVIYVKTDFPEWGSIMMLLHRLYPEVRLAEMSFHHKEPFVKCHYQQVKKVPVTHMGEIIKENKGGAKP